MQQATIKTALRGKPGAAYVRKCALKAFFITAGTSTGPAGVAGIAEGFGYDPIRHTEAEMVRTLSAHYGRDFRHVHREHAAPVGGHTAARMSRGVARGAVSAARRARLVSKVAGPLGLVVQIAAGVITGGYAYYNTHKLGMACLAAADIDNGRE
jgi:hypothetical protein